MYGEFFCDEDNPVPATSIMDLAGNSVNLVRRLKTKLQVLTTAERRGGYSSGKRLHTRDLIYCNRAFRDSPRYGKVYSRQVSGIELDTCVTLLLDCSGSMERSLFLHAAAATLMLYQVMSRIDIPVRIEGFSTYYRADSIRDRTELDFEDGVLQLEVCDFDEKAADFSIAERLSFCDAHKRNNNDPAAISLAYADLLKREEARKILIVLSDGAPADGNSGYKQLHSLTKDMVATIEYDQNVEIYGIGMETDSVEQFYTANAVFRDKKDLEQNLIQFCEAVLLSPYTTNRRQ